MVFGTKVEIKGSARQGRGQEFNIHLNGRESLNTVCRDLLGRPASALRSRWSDTRARLRRACD